MRPLPARATMLLVWFPILLAGCYWISEAERDARWDLDGDGVERPADCDDNDDALAERIRFHLDADGDGYGDPNTVEEACIAPEGFVLDNTDCDDTRAATNPGAEETCNTIDDDCDRAIDEGTAVLRFYLDADGDGAGDLEQFVEACTRPTGYVAVGNDCDDSNPDVAPSMPEVCNGIDDDCDDDIDLDDVDLDPADATIYADADLDGFGVDTMSQVSCDPPPGWSTKGGDCVDTNNRIYPGATERCNGLDDDCDLTVDEDAIDAIRSYPDLDGDSFGNAAFPNDSCEVPAGYVANGGDCADDNAQANPLADELCATGVNEDCDADIDEPDCEPAPPTETASTGDTGL